MSSEEIKKLFEIISAKYDSQFEVILAKLDNLERKNDTFKACQAVNELHIEELQKSRISEQNINVSPNKDSSDWYGLRPQEIGQKMDNILNSSFSPSPMSVSVFGSPKFEPTTHPPTCLLYTSPSPRD